MNRRVPRQPLPATAADATAADAHCGSGTEVEVYWRPGCSACMALRGPLRRSGLPLQEFDIWADPAAAARLREAAGGNETVPTVVVDGHPLVNPTLDQVIAEVRARIPHLLPTLRAADPGRAPWAVTVVAATVWVLLGGRNPQTTYHLAPLLIGLLPALVGRRHSGRALSRAWALVLAAVGSTVAAGTAVLLAGTGRLAGPDLTGRHHPLLEAFVLASAGGVIAVLLARRGAHRR